MKIKSKKAIIALTHLLVLIIALGSPFWIDWKTVLVGFALYQLQKIIFRGCLLSFAQFQARDNKPIHRFTPYYLKKIFKLQISEEKISFYLELILAPAVPIVAIIIQAIFNYAPLFEVF